MKIIEVAYAKPERQMIVTVKLDDHATIEEAILASGILQAFPEIDLAKHAVGIFGEVKPLTHLLKPNDRVEIYRPLIIDPKKARLERAKC